MHILVVMAHPAGPSLTRSVASSFLDAGAALGHTVELVDLVAEGFDPVFGPADHAAFTAAGPTSPDVRREQQRIDRADHLILVYPVYWWSFPGQLKGWIDRVWVRGVAYELPDGANRIRPLLRNIRRIVVVTSHGSGKGLNMLQGEGGKRIASRSLRVLCHPLARFTWLALYGVDHVDGRRRIAFLDRVERRIRRL